MDKHLTTPQNPLKGLISMQPTKSQQGKITNKLLQPPIHQIAGVLKISAGNHQHHTT